ncbi:MAG: hypothetical protein ISS95_00245, partial [Candidatus Aenigmarchaeota archaeon]|nr:hypothetical protein [Candidatus Aenigmarchaeota archaeon]
EEGGYEKLYGGSKRCLEPQRVVDDIDFAMEKINEGYRIEHSSSGGLLLKRGDDSYNLSIKGKNYNRFLLKGIRAGIFSLDERKSDVYTKSGVILNTGENRFMRFSREIDIINKEMEEIRIVEEETSNNFNYFDYKKLVSKFFLKLE